MTTLTTPPSKETTARRAMLFMLLAALLLVLVVFRPLGSALLLAAVLAVVLWPPQQWLTRRLRGQSVLAASLVLMLVIGLFLGPLVWMSAFVVAEVIGAARFISETVQSEGTRGLLEKLPWGMSQGVSSILEKLGADSSQLTASLQEQLTQSGGSAATMLGAALAATGALMFQGVMMLIALFFFLTNKEGVITWLDEASPLQRGQTRELGREFVTVCKSVVVSTAATALIQALAALVGYFIARVPYPFFFFLLTFVLAFIPAVGAAAVCFLAAGILLVTGHTWTALFLAIYAVVVVGLIDNVAKPWLMKGDLHLHGAVVFFALLGGLAALGPIGLLVGPLAVALFLTLLRMYHRDYPSKPSTIK